ncbi:hypothetical protein TNCV_847091 [Trichonephila clavipes]|nr:hypothetical protein TNCV_847091 [Trichonephila clavipes]
MAQHRPRKPAPVEYSTGEDDMIVYDVEENEFESNPDYVAAIRHISHSCLDSNDFTVVNCIVKGHAPPSLPSLRLRLCSRFTLLAT